MTGVTCEAGNAHSSRAPDFTLQWRVHVVPFLFTDFANVRTSVLLVNDFGCFGIWTAFNVDECIMLFVFGLVEKHPVHRISGIGG